MKKCILKKAALIIFILSFLLLVGCGRSDVTLTVNSDGSFTADVDYSITKSLMANDDVKEQVKSLITDSLDQNNIEYAESENEDYVIISVQRSFADLAELTDENSWKGLSMIPKFSSEKTDGALWTRYEDGKLKIDGQLDADAFGAGELVSQSGAGSDAFGGSLKIVLPDKAESCDGVEDGSASYIWSGTSAESKTVSLVSGELAAVERADASSSEAGAKSSGTVIAIVLLLLAAAVVFTVVKKGKKDNS